MKPFVIILKTVVCATNDIDDIGGVSRLNIEKKRREDKDHGVVLLLLFATSILAANISEN